MMPGPPLHCLLLLLLLLSAHALPSTSHQSQRSLQAHLTRQTESGDGYGGEGFTVRPVLRDETPATAILLHGLGGTGQEWGYVSLALAFFSLNFVKFIIPTAPTRPVTYMRQTIPSWFDIGSLRNLSDSVDRDQLFESVDRVQAIIRGEITAGVPPSRIFLVGFSQGGALALTTFLRTRSNIGGCLGVATWLPLASDYPAELSPRVRNKDILLLHGTEDEVIPIRFAWRSVNEINTFGADLSLTANITRLVGQGHVLVDKAVMDELERYISERASGTTRFLLELVSNLTDSFDSVSTSVGNNPLVDGSLVP